MSKTFDQLTLEDIVINSLKGYEADSPNVYDDSECMDEDFRSDRELLHAGFKSKVFDMNEFLSDYLCENNDFREKIQEIVDRY